MSPRSHNLLSNVWPLHLPKYRAGIILKDLTWGKGECQNEKGISFSLCDWGQRLTSWVNEDLRRFKGSWFLSTFEVVTVVPVIAGAPEAGFCLRFWKLDTIDYIIQTLHPRHYFNLLKNCKIYLKSSWMKKKSIISPLKKYSKWKINVAVLYHMFLSSINVDTHLLWRPAMEVWTMPRNIRLNKSKGYKSIWNF